MTDTGPALMPALSLFPLHRKDVNSVQSPRIPMENRNETSTPVDYPNHRKSCSERKVIAPPAEKCGIAAARVLDADRSRRAARRGQAKSARAPRRDDDLDRLPAWPAGQRG